MAKVSTDISVKSTVSAAEWEQRVNLAACYRAVALHGWDDLIFTHISARVPGEPNHFLINPYGMLFSEITASSLVKIDHKGNKVMDSPYPINPAGFVIHSAIHEARENAQCVLHLHCVYGVAVASQKKGLLPISQQAVVVHTSLAYHDYEGIALNEDEKPRLVRDLGGKHFLILRNHGLLTVADNIADAFVYMYLFEKACEVQVLAQSGGSELIEVDRRIIDGTMAQAKTVMGEVGGAFVWPAILRRLDAADSSYRN